MDWSWWRKAPQEQLLSDRIQMFFRAQGLSTYGDVYTLERDRHGRHGRIMKYDLNK